MATSNVDPRDEILALARRLPLSRLSRELGCTRSALASLMVGRAHPGTRALVAPALDRLRRELAAFDAANPSPPPRAA